ncbi:MAG TPA: hypothetical protein VOA41_20010 [Candidatus Dormibacteraeota bacterium]|nr:hypothetical protein [Candidatus Dormibacteraeota bacterium]
MHASLFRLVLVLVAFAEIAVATNQATSERKSVVRGWLSDEACAGGRASSGVYTGTNPECARKCVSNGKKIVLVDPEGKRLLAISNQNAAMERVGDYVEIKGELNEEAKTLHIDSVELLEKGVVMCRVRPRKKT